MCPFDYTAPVNQTSLIAVVTLIDRSKSARIRLVINQNFDGVFCVVAWVF